MQKNKFGLIGKITKAIGIVAGVAYLAKTFSKNKTKK